MINFCIRSLDSELSRNLPFYRIAGWAQLPDKTRRGIIVLTRIMISSFSAPILTPLSSGELSRGPCCFCDFASKFVFQIVVTIPLFHSRQDFQVSQMITKLSKINLLIERLWADHFRRRAYMLIRRQLESHEHAFFSETGAEKTAKTLISVCQKFLSQNASYSIFPTKKFDPEK